MTPYIPLFLIFLLVAVILRQTAVLTILYMIAAIYLTGRLWSQRAIRSVEVERQFVRRAFLDQQVPVRILVRNRGRLPVIWLRLHESLPVGMTSPNYYQQVISLGGRTQQVLEYRLNARKRGYYPLGPLVLTTGDLLGLAAENRVEVEADSLIVYPRIVPLKLRSLLSRSPFGSIRETNPLFEDPSRTVGKRDYQTGDSMRHLDWKATAAVGRLQVKQYEPSIALETAVYLNLNIDDYTTRHRLDLAELAIIAAASIASWASRRKHPIGLVSNGADPLSPGRCLQPLAPRGGSAHLAQVLDALARIETSDGSSFLHLLRETSADLTWGTTLVVITGQLNDELLGEIFPIHRRGLNVVLVPVGPVENLIEHKHRAEHFGFPVRPVQTQSDLESW